MRAAGDSHVRLRAMPIGGTIDWLDAQELLDELCEDQLNLSMGIACIERALEGAPRGPSARAALRSLDERIADLKHVRDELAQLQLLAVDARLHRIFLAEDAFSDYLRGLYGWAHAVVRALEQIANSLRTLSPDWALFRWRIEEAKNFHFDELEDPIRGDLAALAVLEGGSSRVRPQYIGALCVATEQLFVAAHALEESLDQRFC